MSERAAGWRPPRGAVLAVAVALLATVAGGWAAVGAVRQAAARPSLEVVDAATVVAVRPRGRDGELVLTLRNAGRDDARVTTAALDVDGVAAPEEQVDTALPPGGRAELVLPYSAPSCEAVGRRGAVVLGVRVADGAPQEQSLLVGAVPLTGRLLAAGCGAEHEAGGIAVSVRGRGGEAYRDGTTVRGTVAIEVRNLGAEIDLVRLRAEVPGVIFWPAGVSDLSVGGSVQLHLPFQVADCSLQRRTGRVVVGVVDDQVGEREVGFRATEDEEARTLRDIDLETVHRACATTQTR